MTLKYKLIVHDLDAGEDEQSIILAGIAPNGADLARIAHDAAALLYLRAATPDNNQLSDGAHDAQSE